MKKYTYSNCNIGVGLIAFTLMNNQKKTEAKTAIVAQKKQVSP
jgi:hypothetical protein